MNRNTQLLEKEALDQLQQQADNIGVHRAHILAAAVALCFYSLTGSEYLNFSMPVTGTRERNSIGMTSNVVPLIIKVEPQLSLAEFIQKVAAEIAKVVRHQLYRGEDIRRDNGATDSAQFNPSINIVSFDHGDPFWGAAPVGIMAGIFRPAIYRLCCMKTSRRMSWTSLFLTPIMQIH